MGKHHTIRFVWNFPNGNDCCQLFKYLMWWRNAFAISFQQYPNAFQSQPIKITWHQNFDLCYSSTSCCELTYHRSFHHRSQFFRLATDLPCQRLIKQLMPRHSYIEKTTNERRKWEWKIGSSTSNGLGNQFQMLELVSDLLIWRCVDHQ